MFRDRDGSESLTFKEIDLDDELEFHEQFLTSVVPIFIFFPGSGYNYLLNTHTQATRDTTCTVIVQ